jgi:hypothetical protein
MPGPIEIQDEGLIPVDHNQQLSYRFNYDDENLASGVQLASVGTFTVTPTGPALDSQALVTGNRMADVRIDWRTGTVGMTYLIRHTATTNETPSQVKSKWFKAALT